MNIYISGLNFSTTDADLSDLFSEYGEVSSGKNHDEENKKIRGFRFRRNAGRCSEAKKPLTN